MSVEPAIRNATVAEIADTLRRLRGLSTALAETSTTEIAEAIAEVGERWVSDSSAVRETAERVSSSTGLSVPMVLWSIRELCQRLTVRGLEQLVQFELGVRDPFSAARQQAEATCARLALPPAVATQYVAGTVPSVAVEVIALSLLARVPLLLKTSSDEPYLARAFVDELRSIKPELADCVAVMTWPGGDAPLDDAVAQGSDLVIVYGGTDAVASMRRRCPPTTRFIGYGNRVSLGVISRTDTLSGSPSLRSVALGIALDASAYDQRGCMSPHTIFVATDAPWSPDQLAESLASFAFLRVEEILPRGNIDAQTLARIQQSRGVFEFTGRVYTAPTATILVADDTRFYPSPGGRTLHIVPYRQTSDLLDALAPLHDVLSSASLLCSPQERSTLVSQLGRAGVRRICRPGRMQRPVLIREHDGRPRIADWMNWLSVEPSV